MANAAAAALVECCCCGPSLSLSMANKNSYNLHMPTRHFGRRSHSHCCRHAARETSRMKSDPGQQKPATQSAATRPTDNRRHATKFFGVSRTHGPKTTQTAIGPCQLAKEPQESRRFTRVVILLLHYNSAGQVDYVVPGNGGWYGWTSQPASPSSSHVTKIKTTEETAADDDVVRFSRAFWS